MVPKSASVEVRSGPPGRIKTPLLCLALASDGLDSPIAKKLIARDCGLDLDLIARRGDFGGARDEWLLLPSRPGAAADRIALLGVGTIDAFDGESMRRAAAAIAAKARKSAPRGVLYLDDSLAGSANLDDMQVAEAFAEGVILQSYSFDRFKRVKSPRPGRFTLLVSAAKRLPALRRGLRYGIAGGAGVNTAREIGNLPGNHGQPAVIARQARALAREYGLKCRVLGKKELEAAKMGAFLSVAKGSPHTPRLIVLRHQTKKRGAPTVCLVGKGLTFDSGGISIKPAADMDKMRYDKCGGAAVIGALCAVAKLDLPVNAVGIVPASENMPGGDANKPGDVVIAGDGTSIEILNTDAEGRLILADALIHARTFKPDLVIDLATLTGACAAALGPHCAGLMTTDEDLAQRLAKAGEASRDRVWRLPLWEEHREEMRGQTTDLKNLGGRYAGASTAAAFLAAFAEGLRWAHVDIAGVAWDDAARPYNRGKGATGFGVRLLVRVLRDLVQ